MMGLPKLPSIDIENLFDGVAPLTTSTPRSLRGSVDSVTTRAQAASASAGSTDKAEELMAATPFFLANHFASCSAEGAPKIGFSFLGSLETGTRAVLGGGSTESVKRAASGLSALAGSMAEAGAEGGDKDTELPMFPGTRGRRSGRARRGGGMLSASRSTDDPLRLGSFTGSTQQLARSSEWMSENLIFQSSRSTDKWNFMQVIEEEAVPTPRAADPAPAAAPAKADKAANKDKDSSKDSKDRVSEIQSPRMSTRRQAQASTSTPPTPSPARSEASHRPARAAAQQQKEQQQGSRSASSEPKETKASASKKRKIDGSGTHVKYRPDMQKRARDGQEHWMRQVKNMRALWAERREDTRNPRYQEQVDTCAQLQIKSQHECLLRTLQMCATDGIIVPLPFAECGPNSFLGWTGFQVEQAHAQDFRAKIDNLFPSPLKENTLHTSFRRAGLVPDKWSSGWLGLTPFKFSHDKRVAYAPSAHAAASY
eukprot:CAMPEP_0206250590 /NCGR_PEP_ID=MMETSP0047_2-20121206/21562_1 /ASSEMBLY_ACC=CAM_ASM_000192 /TAXON_ID=195065 /ORGANISM="Chroomonas mesostigmatica_cf, Strain CCMP1168" /LENGTH=482 /DNA_ID=CAMNT_0053676467 /DNA_START=105 /DNA_END=1553 /DNA_ORIENTATION=+